MHRRGVTPLVAILMIVGCFGGPARSDDKRTTRPTTQPAHPFRKNVTVEVTDELLIVHSNGLPDHTTGQFPNRFNPNRILEQNYTFKIPRHPIFSDRVTRTPMGPIGVAINGVPFYNPYNAEGQDAAKNEVFDECCGHPDPMGRYHYHVTNKFPYILGGYHGVVEPSNIDRRRPGPPGPPLPPAARSAAGR